MDLFEATLLCATLHYTTLQYTTLFYSILFYSILFYSILFYSILFYSILFYSILILFYSILSYPILSYPILSYPILFYSNFVTIAWLSVQMTCTSTSDAVNQIFHRGVHHGKKPPLLLHLVTEASSGAPGATAEMQAESLPAGVLLVQWYLQKPHHPLPTVLWMRYAGIAMPEQAAGPSSG